jgi:hypothetical protein
MAAWRLSVFVASVSGWPGTLDRGADWVAVTAPFLRAGGNEMLTQDKLTKALKQANETAKSVLAQGCTTDWAIAAQDAQRAVQEANEYLAAGDMLEAYGLFLFCQRETVR